MIIYTHLITGGKTLKYLEYVLISDYDNDLLITKKERIVSLFSAFVDSI